MHQNENGEYVLSRREYTQLAAAVPASHATGDDGWLSGLFGSSDNDGPGLLEDVQYRHEDSHIITDPKIIDYVGAAVGIERPNEYDEAVRIRISGDLVVDGADIDPASIGKDTPTEEIHSKSNSTEDFNNEVQIQAGDDFKSKIESAPEGTRFKLEPEANWIVDNPPVTVPDKHMLLPSGNTITKGGSGALLEVGQSSYMFGSITFYCNKATYSGDGIVDRANDMGRLLWLGDIRVTEAAGNARVHDSRYRAKYGPGVRFELADGYGVVEGASATPTDPRCRHIHYDHCYISDNGKGAVRAEAALEGIDYSMRAGNNAGAVIELDTTAGGGNSDVVRAVTASTPRWQNNDGPNVVQLSGTIDTWSMQGGMAKNSLRDLSVTPLSGSLTAPYGQFHFENGDVNLFAFEGTTHLAGGADANRFLVGHTGTIESFKITGGDGPGGEPFGANNNEELDATGISGSNWSMAFDVDEGQLTGHTTNGRAFVKDLATGDRKFIGRIDVTSLAANQGDHAVHNGAGNGVQGPAYYNGSVWHYENGVTESANAETPQGTYQPGQKVYFTDTGDGSGDGTYIIDDSGTAQGPV